MSNIALKIVNAWIWSSFPLPWEVFFNDNSFSAWYFLFETNGEQFQYCCNRIMMALMWVCDRMQVYFSLFYVSKLLFSPLSIFGDDFDFKSLLWCDFYPHVCDQQHICVPIYKYLFTIKKSSTMSRLLSFCNH